jgi:ribosomal protein S18 acetylase RimI-like enzyme
MPSTTEPAVLEPHDAAAARLHFGVVRDLYAEVYSEPPYNEGPDDVARFATSWERYLRQPGFRLVLARKGEHAVGMALGHELAPDTDWWQGLLTPLSDGFTGETPGRTFAVIELAVRAPHRRRGIARALHRQLLADIGTERVTLLVRPEPEAAPARSAYHSWGYEKVAQMRYEVDQPTYDVMVRQSP